MDGITLDFFHNNIPSGKCTAYSYFSGMDPHGKQQHSHQADQCGNFHLNMVQVLIIRALSIDKWYA
jgi:hypothetical protein